MTTKKTKIKLDNLKLLKCAYCGKVVKAFRDGLSIKEFFISGMCQTCQDMVFNSEPSWMKKPRMQL